MALGATGIMHGANGHTSSSVTELKNAAVVAEHRLPSVLDPSKLKITLTDLPKPLPPPESLVFGKTMTDHMLVINFGPTTGWTAPEIKPYAPLSLDPASSCLHYCSNVFEGMKAYVGPDGVPRLFRPELNMDRLARSAARVALPVSVSLFLCEQIIVNPAYSHSPSTKMLYLF
jgi:branched-chain amino acid aminotransferase